MTRLTMSSFSNEQVRFILESKILTDLVIGPGEFSVTISRIGPGMVWVKLQLQASDNFTFVPVLTDDLRITVNQSSSERFFLIETSIESNLAFIDMMTAVLNSLSKGVRVDALLEMRNVLAGYLEFFAQRRNLILSRERQRGLFGELIVLKELLVNIGDSFKAINTWQGPLKKPQDFIFKSSNGLEVKSRTGMGNTVVISNEQQLDASQIDSIFLCVFSVMENPAGLSLHAIIRKCLAHCDEATTDAFYGRLRELNLEKWTLPYHDNYRLTYAEPEIYRIDKKSKVITTQNIPDNTSNVRYQLQLSALTPLNMSLKALISKISKDE